MLLILSFEQHVVLASKTNCVICVRVTAFNIICMVDIFFNLLHMSSSCNSE